MDNFVLQRTHGQAVGGFHQERSTTSPYQQYQNQNSVAIERGDLQQLRRSDECDVPLGDWIKGALDSVRRCGGGGISSMDYLKPSLKIAVSLTQQVSEAEHCAMNNYFDKLRLLPSGIGSDWTGHVMVRLKTGGSQKVQRAGSDTHHQIGSWGWDDAWLHEPLPLVIGTDNSTGAAGAGGESEASQDMNQKLEAFLESFGVGVLEGTVEEKCDGPSEMECATGNETCNAASFKTEGLQLMQNTQVLNEQQCEDWSCTGGDWVRHPSPMATDTLCQDEKFQASNEQLESVLKCFHLDEPDAAAAPGGSMAGDLNYLNVESAEILYPERQPFIGANTVAEKRKRIFHLGLVFYVLFAGGEAPPPGLLALALSGGAFVSLSAFTLTEKTDKDCELSNIHKRRFSSRSGGQIGLCHVSLEYLKLIGLPSKLCSLIFNCLDCVNGDLSNEDCYTSVNDVTSDLQLMISKPQKFLQDLDMGKMSLSGFQLNETVFSRKEEFASIQACYRRSVSESYEMAIVAGLSGTGKSWLAQCLGRYIVAQGGQFIWGKFDQLQQAKPFSALACAFEQYCDVLISNLNADWVTLVVAKLQEALGYDVCHLIEVVPKLGQVLPRYSSASAADNALGLDSMHALQRLCYLLCQFVQVISTYSVVSVTLCLDDVQWCDEATMFVLNQLLIKRHKKFFFISCCRSDEMDKDHQFWKTIQSVRSFGVNTTVVKLDCIKKDMINEMVSDLLFLPPRQVRSLTEIVFKKTKGNPLFFVQLMLSLNRDGLLCFSLVRERWVWDEIKIQSMQLPENAAICFSNGIRQLPPEVQLALRTLALFGASAKDEYISALESGLNLNLVGPLTLAASEGLITHLKGSYHFCHDRIQEACYDMMEEKDRRCDHLLYGLCLVKSALEFGNDDMLFLAVNQINLGGPTAVLNTAELAAMARYNLMAAKSAIIRSDFSLAYYFTSHGITFLRSSNTLSNHWAEQYHISLELFEIGCQSALATGNLQSLHYLAGEATNHARCFEDKLNVYYTIMTSLVQSSKVLEALDRSRTILAQLGEVVPSKISKKTLNQRIQQTQSIIRGVSESDLLNYKLMTDNRKLATMKYLAKLEIMALLVNPMLHPFITLRMVQLTISHGLSPMSAIGFAYFGSLLAKQGNIRAGYGFTRLAMNLLNKLNAKEIAVEVSMISAETQCIVEPTGASNELWIECVSTAMAGGDTHLACTAKLQHCTILFWMGTNLSVVHEAGEKACRFMQELGHQVMLFFMQACLRLALTLAGRKNEAIAGQELFVRAYEAKNPRQLMILSFHELYLSFIFDSDDTIKECCEKFICSEKSSSFLFFGDTIQVFIVGLSSFRIYRETRGSLWLERARKCKSDMKLWSDEGSQWNFQHKLLLLQAEDSYSAGDFFGARDLYNEAIQSAKSHKAVNDEALSCELAARFYMETDKQAETLRHLRLAIEKYLEWGALAKADLLFELIKEKFGNQGIGNAGTDGNGDEGADDDAQYNVESDQRKKRAIGLTQFSGWCQTPGIYGR